MRQPPIAPYQPALSRWGHIWRIIGMVILSVANFAAVAKVLWADYRWLVFVDVALGIVGFGLVHLRRRWPVPIAVTLTCMSALSTTVSGPSVLASVSLATRRVWAEVIGIGLLNLAAAATYALLLPDVFPDSSLWVEVSPVVFLITAVLGWGMYIGSRRELVWTLQQRAERAEAEQELRTERARDAERTRIAREMHDVLGHRISQISMHAGALAYRTDLDTEELREGIADINKKAQEALTDLRSVLGVLRDPDTGALLDRPQPLHDDIVDLVREAREAGMHIKLQDDIESPPVPPALGRTLYRIVQEGITNAGKHAPSTTLTIHLSGSPGDGVDFHLRNPESFFSGDSRGGGLGLIGLAERAELGGGRLEHGRIGDAFVLQGWLPWTMSGIPA